MNDPYRHIVRIYDRLFENMNKGLRIVGLRMFRPSEGMKVLDVGCGTGTYLELYQRYQCSLFGIDASPSMLEMARARLGDTARLEQGDASNMPYEDEQFDLIISMLSLHEMDAPTRSGVFTEIQRVLKKDGRILLIDFHPGPYQPLKGWISKLVITFLEISAGWEHFKNYRQFMAQKGLRPLLTRHRLEVQKERLLGGGTFAIYLVASG